MSRHARQKKTSLQQRSANARKKINALRKRVALWFRPRQAPNADPKLVKLEREIGGLADRIHRSARYQKTAAKTQAVISKSVGTANRFLGIAKQKLASGVTSVKTRIPVVAASSRRLTKAAIQGATLTRKTSPRVRTEREVTLKKKKPRDRSVNALEVFLIAAFFGLLFICSAIIVVLFLQLRETKTEIAAWRQNLSEVKARLDQAEKSTQRENNPKPVSQQEHTAQENRLALSEDDIKIIRQYIRVLAPKSPGEARIHVGDEVSHAVPVPDALVEQMPKLRGAKFSIDQNGAIVILGNGSRRADAVISPP